MQATFLALLVCLSLFDVKEKVCWAVCRHDGFDTGTYLKKDDRCLCGTKMTSFKEYTDTVIKIPSSYDPGY